MPHNAIHCAGCGAALVSADDVREHADHNHGMTSSAAPMSVKRSALFARSGGAKGYSAATSGKRNTWRSRPTLDDPHPHTIYANSDDPLGRAPGRRPR